MQNTLFRPVAALLAVQMLLTACGVAAHGPGSDVWPDPKPATVPLPQQVRAAPNFQAPSATHCSRPVSTREIPGLVAQHRGDYWREETPELAKDARSERSAASGAPLATAPATPMPQIRPRESQQQPPREPVTAGMVDDNADFSAYLAFRSRTRVEHRPRDIRERYLLEVKDPLGRGIADAEVAVEGTNGHAMWARTDTAGRAWLHPNAFDPARSTQYRVAVRKSGRIAYGRLVRGQKSAVDVVLDARPTEHRARLDLVFLIDATGSMADEIDKLKTSLRSIAAEVSRLPSQPDICLGLVAYRDKHDAFLVRAHDLTADLDGFLHGALHPLQAAGGGDYPEAMNEALHETVHNISWRGEGATRMVVLLAHYDDEMLAALGKGIKVFSVGASGLDRQGEFIQRQIAQYTGGRFVFLTYADARNPSSGAGRETVHDVRNYSVDSLDRLIVRLVTQELGQLARPS
jgi:hypothetical protein